MVGLEGTSGDHLVQPYATENLPRWAGTGSHSNGFKYHQRTRLLSFWRDNFSGQPVPVLCHFQNKAKNFVLVFRWNFLCFSLCPLTLTLLLVPAVHFVTFVPEIDKTTNNFFFLIPYQHVLILMRGTHPALFLCIHLTDNFNK